MLMSKIKIKEAGLLCETWISIVLKYAGMQELLDQH